MPQVNLTMAPPPVVNAAPSRDTHLMLLLADQIAVDVLAVEPTWEQVANLIIDAKVRHATAMRAQNLTRRAETNAATAAAHLIRYTQPQGLVPVRGDLLVSLTWEAEHQRREVGDHTVPMGAVLGFTRPRVLWCPPAGPSAGLLVDRMHHTHLPDGVQGQWAMRAAVRDAARARSLVGEAFLGVRLIAHRAPSASVHLPPANPARPGVGSPFGPGHRLGDCPWCRPTHLRAVRSSS